jgi:transcriptional regulator with XRE-family HTH domain
MSSIISENLKKYRKLNKLTQQEMAQALFVTPQAVSKW